MHGGIALFVLFVFKHGKIRHQRELEIARVGQSQQVRAFQAQAAQHAPHHLQPVGAEEDEVAGLRVHAHFQIPPHLWFKILGQNGVDLAGFAIENPGHALGAEANGLAGKQLNGGAGKDRARALDIDGTHYAAAFQRFRKDGKRRAARDVAHIHDGQIKTQIRLVAAIAVHGLQPGEPPEGMRHGAAHHPLKQPGEQIPEKREHILLVHEASLHVHLGKLGLAVGAQILVAEAAGHLIVFVDTRHHQELLVDLRALGQGIECAGVHTAGYQIVARALRSGFAQDGRFHLQKALIVEKALHLAQQRVAKEQVSVHLRAAQVQIAVFEPHLFAHRLLVGQGKGQRIRRGEHLHMADGQLHLTGGQGGVIGAFVAQAHLSGDLHHALVFEPFGQCKAGGIRHGLIKDRLHYALAVAHIHEDDAAHVAAGQHPAAHRSLQADVRTAQGSAVMRSFHKAATSLVAGYEKSPPPRHLRGERPKPSAVPPALDKICPAHKRERH